MTITLTVRGTPAPKGSRTLGRRRNGTAYTRPASAAEAGWVEAVAVAAMATRARAGTLDPPYAVELTFAMPRPARPAHEHPTRTDLDKLTRAVLDGLTRGGLIADDRHVIELRAAKGWAKSGAEGVTVTVSGGPLPPPLRAPESPDPARQQGPNRTASRPIDADPAGAAANRAAESRSAALDRSAAGDRTRQLATREAR